MQKFSHKILTLLNNTLAKYLMANVWALLAAIFLLIGLLIFGNQLVLVVKESLQKGIPVTDLFPLIALKVLGDSALILSLSLFLAIIVSIGRLYKTSEAIVMNSFGLGDKHFMLFILPVVLSVFIFVLLLTTTVAPWSEQKRDLIMQRTENISEFLLIKQNEFQTFKNGDIVFYAAEASSADDAGGQNMEDIFIYDARTSSPIITLAKRALKYTDLATNNVYLRLKEGGRYYGFLDDNNKEILNFDSYDLRIIDPKARKPNSHNTDVEGRNTQDLWRANGTYEVAELQWRLSQPLGVLILSILGVLLGKASPRGGKNLGVLFGVVVFIVYNNALLIAKSSLEAGELSAMIGLWWVHLLMLFLVMLLYFHRHGHLRKFRLKLLTFYRTLSQH